MSRQIFWERMLSVERLGDVQSSGQETVSETSLVRSPFEQDVDRITFSSAFRRLQDKTQVFPLSSSDYTRTRLTHSLEVASVGRSLGKSLGVHLAQKNLLPSNLIASDIGTIVQAACLAHDIGNPPFGHSGEEAIRGWFAEYLESKPELRGNLFSPTEQKDFLRFEGNAQGFRICARLRGRDRKGGMRLTFATLGAMMKYPVGSSDSSTKYKKFGFFDHDALLAQEVIAKLGLSNGQRHPLVFLMEAADDICYRVVDVEDAYRLGILSEDRVRKLFLEFGAGPAQGDLEGQIPSLRAGIINQLIVACSQAFEKHLEEYESGLETRSLLKLLDEDLKNAVEALETEARSKIYPSRRVLEIELAGYEVIHGLLDTFANAIATYASSIRQANESVKRPKDGIDRRSEKIVQLIPIGYLRFHEFGDSVKQPVENLETLVTRLSPYQRLLVVTDFVSGMTDGFALELYQKLRGIQLAS